MRKIAIIIALVFSFQHSRAQVDLEKLMHHPWVDSVYNSLSPDGRIGQLVWIDVTAKNNLEKQLLDAESIKKYGFGGIIFFEGDPLVQANLTNFYQSLSATPLLVAMDAEWGIGMRLPGVMPFPYNMALGATGDTSLAHATGVELARQMKRMGMHIALGPSCDINTEPLNPIIGMRSFGESRELVTKMSLASMKGLQENGIMATAKHFPGHGDTKTDSHLSLPYLPWTNQRLDSLELYPFRILSGAGVGCVMTAHLFVPAIDSSRNLPSSLSPKIVGRVLLKEWNFKGLVITDAMNMKGVRGYEKPGKLEVLALKAGNDVIEFPSDPAVTVQAIKEALYAKELSPQEIEHKCRRVLAAKLWCGLNHYSKINTTHLMEELNTPQAELIKRKTIESSVTVLENRDTIIPVRHLEKRRIAAISVGSDRITPFQRMLSNYSRVDFFQLRNDFSETERRELQEKLKEYNLVIAGIHSIYESKLRQSMQVGMAQKMPPARPYGVTTGLDSLIAFLAGKPGTIVDFFGSPYGLGELSAPVKSDGLIMSYQNDSLTQELSAQLIFGGTASKGKLPVTIPGLYGAGEGITTGNPIRLKYTLPEEAGIQSDRLCREIDSIAGQAMAQGAFPGCNILMAKDGKVIFQRAYGFHTYDKKLKTQKDDLYDLASVTKITGGLPVWMKLYNEGLIHPDDKVSDYYRDWKKRPFHYSDKSDITIRELLSHQSGLVPFIPFWKQSLKQGKVSPGWYAFEPDSKHTLQVAKGLYLDNKFKDKIYKTIRKTPLKSRGTYVYSDLPLVMTPEISTGISGKDFLATLDEYFYKPLGAGRITYNPLSKFSEDEIIPTEKDDYYRKQQLIGTVHDESSATMGGISGNAGLFASANDLAKLLQMYLQKGSYGGREFLKTTTLDEFTRVQFPRSNNRRGLGFDKPLLNNSLLGDKEAYPVKAASPGSFGHSGYTGTFVWVDPKYGLVYIFLSNRVFPTRNNNKIGELNVRTEILRMIYKHMVN